MAPTTRSRVQAQASSKQTPPDINPTSSGKRRNISRSNEKGKAKANDTAPPAPAGKLQNSRGRGRGRGRAGARASRSTGQNRSSQKAAGGSGERSQTISRPSGRARQRKQTTSKYLQQDDSGPSETFAPSAALPPIFSNDPSVPAFEQPVDLAAIEAQDTVATILSANTSEQLANVTQQIADKYRKRGQHVPEGLEEMVQPPDDGRSARSYGSKLSMASVKAEKGQLADANIGLQPEPSPGDGTLMDRIKSGLDAVEQIPRKEERWQRDIEKSSRETEHVYQRTVMMKSINRHGLKDTCLDWGVENQWGSSLLPIKAGSSPLKRPRPDLSLAFRSRRLYKGGQLDFGNIPKRLQSCMHPEEDVASYRAFPFFLVEAKATSANANGEKAKNQGLRYAAHALYNIWEFVKGNDELEEDFFKSVRVFTAGANGLAFWIRVHRAIRPSRRQWIRPDYPLGFMFDDVDELRGANYSQARVQRLVGNIQDWAVKELAPRLENAVEHVLEQESRRNEQMELPQSGLEPDQPSLRDSLLAHDGTAQSAGSGGPNSRSDQSPGSGRGKKRAAAPQGEVDKRKKQSDAANTSFATATSGTSAEASRAVDGVDLSEG